MNKEELQEKTLLELQEIAKENGITGFSKYKKAELLEILEQKVADEPKEAPQKEAEERDGDARSPAEGILEVMPDGYGFLRGENYLSTPLDVYVSQNQIRRFNLKTGDRVNGYTRECREGEKFKPLIFVKTVNGDLPIMSIRRKPFEQLTPIYPNEMLCMEHEGCDASMRAIDLISPIGKGQRGLIVAPPKAGKTTLLKNIAQAISINNPECELIVLLVDERPEEVTDIERAVHGDIVYSTFDQQPEHHIKVAEIVLERAKRIAEHGKDAVILLDSITRLARAYNLVIPPSGRTLSGGLDPASLYKPKRFFGAARNIENGGSVTILATALVDTGSRMDEVIYEEFKGTGNMEIHLDRKLQERRIFPSIDLFRSGTRKEELLVKKEYLSKIWAIRNAMSGQNNLEVAENLIHMILATKTNKELLDKLKIKVG